MGAMWVICVMLSLTALVPLMAGSPITEVTVEQAQKLMQQRARQKDFVVLDVRTPGEFSEGHLAGAVNLDLLAPDFAAPCKRSYTSVGHGTPRTLLSPRSSF